MTIKNLSFDYAQDDSFRSEMSFYETVNFL